MRVFLREATNADMALVYAWEQNPLIHAGFYSPRGDLCWERHCRYWHKETATWKKYIICLLEDNVLRPIGQLRIALLDYWCPEIGYTIGEISLWGKGYGTEAVRQACQWLKDKGYEWAQTTVLKNNLRSIALLKRLGFEQNGNARKNELRFTLNLNNLK